MPCRPMWWQFSALLNSPEGQCQLAAQHLILKQAWLKALLAALANFAMESLNNAQLNLDVALAYGSFKIKSDNAHQQLEAF